MKSLKLTMLTLSSALCLTLGAFCMVDANVAKADNATGTTPVLSTTKVQISKNNDKMLLVTAIKDMTDVYEVGYMFTDEVETIFEETTKYYTSIGDGTTTLTAGDIFDEAWTDGDDVGMIIWEVEFGFGTTYEYKAYAKVGERNEEGALVAPTTENVVTPASAISNTFYSATFKAEDEVVFSQIYNNVNNLAEPEVPFKAGYVGAWEEYNPAAGNVTVNATYTEMDYTQYPIYQVSAEMDGRYDGTVTLPEEVSGYQKIYAKLASYTANPNYETGATINEDGTLNVPKGAPNAGQNLIRMFMNKGNEYATVEISLFKAKAIIKTRDDLKVLLNDLNNGATKNQHYVLGADIDWADPDNGKPTNWMPGWSTGKKNFQGTLDGRGHTIANYYAQYGLCYILEKGAQIKNVHLKPVIRTNTTKVSGVCLINEGTVENCFVDISITDAERTVQVGGVVANNEKGVISNCIVTISKFVSTTDANWIGDVNMSAITLTKSIAGSGSESNCYAINKIATEQYLHVNDMFGDTATAGLFTSARDFFGGVTSLSTENGWSSYWKIENGGLYFNGAKVL